MRFLEAMPLVLAAVYYLLTPFFVGQVRREFAASLARADAEWKGPDQPLPPHRTTAFLGSNIDWIVDAPQLVPCLLLPLAAVLFAFRDSAVAAVILSLSVVVICAATLWIYSRPPLAYRSLSFAGGRYTPVTAAGLVLNLGAAILLVAR